MASFLDRYKGYEEPEDEQDDETAAPSAPIADDALSALSKTNPDLVQQYRERIAASKKEQTEARQAQDIGNYANVAGKLLNDYNNSQKRDVVLGNRMQDLGKAPTIVKADRPEYDASPINTLSAQAVARANQDRQQTEQDFGEEQKLTDLGQRRADQDVARQRMARENDPNSPESEQARNYLKSIAPSAASIPGFEKMTAAQARAAAPQLLDKYKLDENVAARRDKAVSESEDRKLKYASLADFKAQAADAAKSKMQDAAMKDSVQMLESARGQPAMAQAEKDLYAAQKANSLANLYKDPNNLSPQQVQLLASEIGKIAQGGVTSQHELEAITPHTLNSQLAGITQKFTNQPSPANAAAFVKQYQDYANQLAKDAQKQIQDKYGRVIESKKGKLSDEDYQTLQNQYINRFKSDDIPDKTPPAPIHPVGSVITTKSGKSYKVVDDQGNLEEVKP